MFRYNELYKIMQKYTLYDKTNKTESRIRFSTVVSTKKRSNNHNFDYFVYFGFCKPAGQQKVFATGLQRSVAETFYIVHRRLEQIVYHVGYLIFIFRSRHG